MIQNDSHRRRQQSINMSLVNFKFLIELAGNAFPWNGGGRK